MDFSSFYNFCPCCGKKPNVGSKFFDCACGARYHIVDQGSLISTPNGTYRETPSRIYSESIEYNNLPNSVVVGDGLYVRCKTCGKMVKANKFLLGDLHFCV